MLNYITRPRIININVNPIITLLSCIQRRFITKESRDPQKDSKKSKEPEKLKVKKSKRTEPYLLINEVHSIDENTIGIIMTNRSLSRTTRSAYFTVAVRPWNITDKYFTKKTKQPITTYRLQTVVSKKKVCKLAVVRNRIKRRIREAARYALPAVGRVRHDYLFFASIEAYSCPWQDLLDAVKIAIGDPRCYKKEAIGRGGGGGGGGGGDSRGGKFDRSTDDQRRPSRNEDYKDRKDYKDHKDHRERRDYKDRKDRNDK